MKNKLVFMFLAIVLAFGFVLSGCAAAPASTAEVSATTITITGLEAHNGKYCWAWGNADGVNLLAGSLNVDWSDEGDNWTPGVIIANGSVTLILQYWGNEVKDHPYLAGGEDTWLLFHAPPDGVELGFGVCVSEKNLNDTGASAWTRVKFSDRAGTGVFGK